jgi:hypothetical protein
MPRHMVFQAVMCGPAAVPEPGDHHDHEVTSPVSVRFLAYEDTAGYVHRGLIW